MEHITTANVHGWRCSCGAGEEWEVEERYPGSPRNFYALTGEAERLAARHEAEMRGTNPVYCRTCGMQVGEQDAVYALEWPTNAADQRAEMLCPVCDCNEVEDREHH
jgi:hypothetical protein